MKNIMNTALAAKKKNYIVPVIEAMPVCSMSALCVSVGGTGGGTLSFTPPLLNQRRVYTRPIKIVR